METIIKRALIRFVRGFIFAGISAMAIIIPNSMDSWGDLSTWIGILLLAGTFAGITGGLQAIDKYLRDLKNEQSVL